MFRAFVVVLGMFTPFGEVLECSVLLGGNPRTASRSMCARETNGIAHAEIRSIAVSGAANEGELCSTVHVRTHAEEPMYSDSTLGKIGGTSVRRDDIVQRFHRNAGRGQSIIALAAPCSPILTPEPLLVCQLLPRSLNEPEWDHGKIKFQMI